MFFPLLAFPLDSRNFVAQLFPLTPVTFLWRRVSREGALWGFVTGGAIALVPHPARVAEFAES
ncbi:hypothetical protein [Candidatus Palauibacter sp.]|uniref:hypothetical protein n=1 Tax=Candidatus Palauibacter sp. TaxID=3101350 RepID=UPI003B01B396